MSRDAKVISTSDNWDNSVWGCEFYNDGELVKTEWYPMHNELYASDAADNYIAGIKTLDDASAPNEIQLELFDDASIKERLG